MAPNSNREKYEPIARAAAIRHGVDPDIYVRLILQESGFSPTAESPAGAYGIAQFMPDTATQYGLDPTDPVASLDAGAVYLKNALARNNGNYAKALASYNAGQGGVNDAISRGGDRDWSNYLPDETKKYLNIILWNQVPDAPPAPKKTAVGGNYEPIAKYADGSILYEDPDTGNKIKTDANGVLIEDESRSGSQRIQFPSEVDLDIAQADSARANAAATRSQTRIAERAASGDLIKLPDGSYNIPGTSVIIDPRSKGEFVPVRDMPGYFYDTTTGEVIDGNDNIIQRDTLDFTKSKFATEHPEQVRQFNAGIDQQNRDRASREAIAARGESEGARQFDLTRGDQNRQFDLTRGDSNRQFDLTRSDKNAQFDRVQDLEEEKNVQGILSQAPDYLARAFKQRGGTSPLPEVTQADLINRLRRPEAGGQPIGPAGSDDFNPDDPYAWHEEQGNLGAGGRAGLTARIRDQFSEQVGNTARYGGHTFRTGGADEAALKAGGITTVGDYARTFGAGGGAVTGAAGRTPGTFSLSQTPATRPTIEQAPPLVEGVGSPNSYGVPGSQQWAENDPNMKFAAKGGKFKGSSRVMTGDGGKPEIVTVKGPPDAVRRVFIHVDPEVNRGDRVDAKAQFGGDFPASSSLLKGGPVQQSQILDTARKFQSPGISSVLGGQTAGSMRFQENIFTPEQLQSLTPENLQELNTRLAAQNESLGDYMFETKRRFGATRSRSRARQFIG